MANLFQNLEYIGMFSMGAFVGGILNYGLAHIADNKTFLKISTAILGAAFSGVVFVFLQFLLPEHANLEKYVFMYPVGLLLALLWLQVPESINNRIAAGRTSLRVVGWIHFISVTLITILILSLLIFSDIHLNDTKI